MKLLLEEGKSPLNVADIDGLTALHHAISEGHGEAALVLLRAGAETDIRDGNDNLAIELAPDSKVGFRLLWETLKILNHPRVKSPGPKIHPAGCRARRYRIALKKKRIR